MHKAIGMGKHQQLAWLRGRDLRLIGERRRDFLDIRC